MTDPETLCILCPVLRSPGKPRRPMRMPVCDACRIRLHGDLAGLPDAYAALSSKLEPGKLGTERGGQGFESRLPLDVAALNLLGPGSLWLTEEGWRWPSDQHGDRPPVTLLDGWAAEWRQLRNMREQQPGATVTELTTWLLNRLDWAIDHHPAVDEFAADMSGLARSLRAVSQTGHSKGESAGRCPRVTRDDQRCGAKLYVDPYTDHITCGRCGTTWERRKGEWLKLRGEQLEAAS